MTWHSERSHLVGYDVHRTNIAATSVSGSAVINSELVEHELSICVHQIDAIDVGRNLDGETVWISPKSKLPPPALSFISGAGDNDHEELPKVFDPVVDGFPEAEVIAATNTSRTMRNTLVTLAGKKRLFLPVGLVLVIAISAIVFIPEKEGQALKMEQSTPQPTISAGEETDPEQAAIAFVVGGSLSGITAPPGLRTENVQATVVSTNGEVVLVEVSLMDKATLTSFATLLLQKTGATWRIREVFDPQRN